MRHDYGVRPHAVECTASSVWSAAIQRRKTGGASSSSLLPRRRVHTHVELREGSAEKLVDLLLEGEINAATVGDVQDIPARIDDWLLFEERYVVVLAPTHQLANPPSIGIDDLRETILLQRAGCDVGPKILRSYFPEEPPVSATAEVTTCTCSTWRPRQGGSRAASALNGTCLEAAITNWSPGKMKPWRFLGDPSLPTQTESERLSAHG
ncbi:LysR family transcriptional regulator substrate-binding protein [Mesorhizobium sp. M0166]|uniref:LysR family transcriptional regulator substrate-binding protein n=1 Tax=Mesorhizobium sp. M0166 TaxID=2956902 RepID=UPI00333D7189